MGKPLMIVVAAVIVGYWYFHGQASPRGPFDWNNSSVTTLTSELHDARGHQAPAQTLHDAKCTLVYFSASWCGPCRAFTPKLVEYYRTHGGGTKFQLVFVSNDRSASAMQAYMHDDAMPWWGADFGSASAQSLIKAYEGPGIPCLVMIDDKGRVLADSFVNGNYQGPQAVLQALDEKHL